MSRTTRRTTTAVAVLAASALLLGGCTAGASDPEPTSPEDVTAGQREDGALEPAPPLRTESASSRDTAVAQAEAAVKEYYRTEATTLQNPDAADVSTFQDVAISSALNDLRNWRVKFRSENWRQKGEQVPEVLDVRAVDLTNKPDAEPPVVPRVDLKLCLDAGAMDILDAQGNSVKAENTPDRLVALVTVENHKYPRGPWLVSYFEPQEPTSC